MLYHPIGTRPRRGVFYDVDRSRQDDNSGVVRDVDASLWDDKKRRHHSPTPIRASDISYLCGEISKL